MSTTSASRFRLRDVLSSFRREAAAPEGDAALTIPTRAASAASVGVGDALGLSAVYRAISIHAVAAKQLSFAAFRAGVELTPEQTPAWIRRPDLDSSRSAFLEQTVASMACTGNAYWLITRNERGVSNLEVLNPLDVFVQTNAAGKAIAYRYQGRDHRPDDIQHLRLLRVPGTPYGLGPIQAAQRELRGALDVRDYASNWFTGSGAPAAGYLATDQPLNPDLAKQYRDNWTTATANREGVPVLGSGAKFVQLYLSPEDALWIDAQSFNVTAAARLFGVPASLMLATVEGNTQTYANVSQDWLGYLRFSLMQYLIEIEDALTALLPRGTEAKFNVEALLRSDTATRYAAHAAGIAAGWLLRSEVRAIENLPPIAGIDDAPLPTLTTGASK
jgi:HK97 family phage portal protein